MYKQIISRFREGRLQKKLGKINVKQFISSNPDLFEVYMLAKSCQMDESSSSDDFQDEFDDEIKRKEAYRYFFFYEYLRKLKKEFKFKGKILLKSDPFMNIQQTIELQGENGNTGKLIDIVRENKHLAIKGKAGFGKTFSLEKILMECIENKLFNLIPVYLELDGCSMEGINSRIDNLLLENSGGMFALEELQRYSPANSLIFLFDGIDEMHNFESSELRRKIDDFLGGFRNECRFVITSRPLFSFRDAKILKLKTFEITPLKSAQIRFLLKKYFTFYKEPQKVKIITDFIAERKKLEDLLSTPLNLIVLCNAFIKKKKIREQDMPINEGQIFQNFINELELRAAKRSRAKTYNISFRTLRIILGVTAYEIYKSGNMPYKNLKQIIKTTDDELNPDRMIEEIIDRGFLRRTSCDDYYFSHKKWQAYFAATFFEENINLLMQDIPIFAEELKWDEVFLMLMGVISEEERKETFIKEMSKLDVFFAAHCIGESGLVDNKSFAKILDKLKELSVDKENPINLRMMAVDSLGEAGAKKYEDVLIPVKPLYFWTKKRLLNESLSLL